MPKNSRRSRKIPPHASSGSADDSLKHFLSESKRVFESLYRQNPDPAIIEVRDELNRLVKCGELSIHDGNEFIHNPWQYEKAINEMRSDRKDDAISAIKEELKKYKTEFDDIKRGISIPVVLSVGVVSGIISTLIFTAFISPFLDFQKNANQITEAQDHFAFCDNGSTCNFNNATIINYYKNQNYKNRTPFHPEKYNRSAMYRPQRIGNGS